MKSIIDRRTLLIGTTATAALQCHILPALGRTSEKAAFMKAAMADINRHNKKVWESYEEDRARGYAHLWINTLPTIKPFGDWDYYYPTDPVYWRANVGQSLHNVTVPAGFVSDLASVPRFLWGVFPRTGRYAYAAIVHDYLYWVQYPDVPREEADKILETAMRDSGVRSATVWSFTNAVAMVGKKSWDENTRLRQSGERRFLKEFPKDPLVSWEDWKKDPAHLSATPAI